MAPNIVVPCLDESILGNRQHHSVRLNQSYEIQLSDGFPSKTLSIKWRFFHYLNGPKYIGPCLEAVLGKRVARTLGNTTLCD